MSLIMPLFEFFSHNKYNKAISNIIIDKFYTLQISIYFLSKGIIIPLLLIWLVKLVLIILFLSPFLLDFDLLIESLLDFVELEQ